MGQRIFTVDYSAALTQISLKGELNPVKPRIVGRKNKNLIYILEIITLYLLPACCALHLYIFRWSGLDIISNATPRALRLAKAIYHNSVRKWKIIFAV